MSEQSRRRVEVGIKRTVLHIPIVYTIEHRTVEVPVPAYQIDRTVKVKVPVHPIPGRLRRALKRPRAMTTKAAREVVSKVPCPNRTCGAGVGQPCKGTEVPHPARVRAATVPKLSLSRKKRT